MKNLAETGTSVKITRDLKISKQHGGFGIEMLFPGQALGREDSGLGTIGRIDHAKITPGTLIPMHPHRDDEIITYLRSGSVQHKDSEGHTGIISNTSMMLMNAGSMIQHEEQSLPEAGLLTGLQIFFRPEKSGLPPKVQFHTFPEVFSLNQWRNIAGRDSSSPLIVRSDSWLYDVRLEKDQRIFTTLMSDDVTDVLIYLFDGELTIAGAGKLKAGESMLVGNEQLELFAIQTSDVVLFATNSSAKFAVDGMYSGDISGRY
jgi:redox-sensitive bicupin YhaK (pirin superfamily)